MDAKVDDFAMSPEIAVLRRMVKGVYDLQQLRIASGLRLCANFRAKLGLLAPVDADAAERAEDDEAVAKEVIAELKRSYRRLTDGVARNRTLPKREGFSGDELIAEYSELVLVSHYVSLESAEARQFRDLETILEPIPIYSQWLRDQPGVGPAMAGVCVAYLNPRKARNISSFWKYAGLDVVHEVDGLGRSRRVEHLVDREYLDRDGNLRTKKSVTFEPFLKTKLAGVLSGSFLRSNAQPWRSVYDGYKQRIISDPNKIKITTAEWRRRHAAGEPVRATTWRPQRIHDAAKRYMVKQFLAQLWLKWRELEGLPITEPYAVAKLGMRPHGV